MFNFKNTQNISAESVMSLIAEIYLLKITIVDPELKYKYV